MKERPILFNGAMVRAILAGQKTQTRRLLKSQHVAAFAALGQRPCHLGKPGDRLWVRESYADLLGTGIEHRPDPSGPMQRYAYAADTPPGSAGDFARKDYGVRWRPSIHMPREACRLVLEITEVRVERLQQISEADATAEGIERYVDDGVTYYGPHGRGDARPDVAFRDLWTSTGGDWDSNPWVWAIGFKRVSA
ncbi:hypothetical protein L3067_04335 [Xanthomonas sp. PPL568]|uniref:hypothetical protein n=1 Tax=Xanthomonas indica TaxID=2912242 RepID=UPI001F57833B|nr:hypothetical protein [Xanthomonas indica]MCI2243836.1 hypothetical protein [Xanthomonas indica]